MNSISVVVINTEVPQRLVRTEVSPTAIPNLLEGWPLFVKISSDVGMYINDDPDIQLKTFNQLATQLLQVSSYGKFEDGPYQVFGKAVLFGLLPGGKNTGKPDGKEHSAPKWVERILYNPTYITMMYGH